MKLSECTYGKIVVLNYPDGGSIVGTDIPVGMIVGITQNLLLEPVPVVQWQNGNTSGCSHGLLKSYEE